MIRDTYLRALSIPLLGMIIPLISGIITYNRYSIPELIGANLFFIFTSYIIWVGCNWIHSIIRRFYKSGTNAFSKIFSLCMVSALYGAAVGGFLCMIWFQFSKEVFSWHGLLKFITACVLAVIVFTLVYEILFLSKERELDTKIVDQLDRERSQAELTALTSELDPHFMFNSLNTLSHLIINDPPTAHLFNSRLARVYRYILINKERELISIHDEMEFIENYFYLLQIRHDNKLKLETNLDGVEAGKIMILPCALQILVENAIKHNEFSEANPLRIRIGIHESSINVTNNVKPKPFLVNSTKIGLRNLSSRYKLVCNQDIKIESVANEFTVKLPLIQ
ncbi:MAG TPA: sensor histidine kinase [Chitinophagaceae bacterium]|nr:sensor histidine kinase [Chitinophagaceae bacterium]